MVQVRKIAKKDGVRKTPEAGDPHYATTADVADAFRMLYARWCCCLALRCGFGRRGGSRKACSLRPAVSPYANEIVLAWKFFPLAFTLYTPRRSPCPCRFRAFPSPCRRAICAARWRTRARSHCEPPRASAAARLEPCQHRTPRSPPPGVHTEPASLKRIGAVRSGSGPIRCATCITHLLRTYSATARQALAATSPPFSGSQGETPCRRKFVT
jgi:hypothetical protein